mmetsp:Transcript_8210/g.33180  ORF Transcript_8210/g.33180 Transcript_8210/m.33180 type:complete len:211 (+) Transcript_8210:1710-2342(+)
MRSRTHSNVPLPKSGSAKAPGYRTLLFLFSFFFAPRPASYGRAADADCVLKSMPCSPSPVPPTYASIVALAALDRDDTSSSETKILGSGGVAPSGGRNHLATTFFSGKRIGPSPSFAGSFASTYPSEVKSPATESMPMLGRLNVRKATWSSGSPSQLSEDLSEDAAAAAAARTDDATALTLGFLAKYLPTAASMTRRATRVFAESRSARS